MADTTFTTGTLIEADWMNDVNDAVYGPATSFTPTISFTTPGDLAVTYTVNKGTCSKIGKRVFVDIYIQTATFTHTTASGSLLISGLPFTSASAANYYALGGVEWQGITKASASDVSCRLPNSSTSANLVYSGSGAGTSFIAAADMPTGGNVVLVVSMNYLVD